MSHRYVIFSHEYAVACHHLVMIGHYTVRCVTSFMYLAHDLVYRSCGFAHVTPSGHMTYDLMVIG